MRRVALSIGMLVVAAALAIGMSSAPGAGEAPSGAKPDRAPKTVAKMRAAAVAFLDSLDAKLRDQATFEMDDEERKKWSNLPHTSFQRLGVSFREMSSEQRVLAQRLIASPLSGQGYLKASGIMHVDQILVELSGGRRSEMFGQGFYWLGIFGEPASDAAWGWQLDGHHLALNFTVVGDRVSVTPAFLGADPAEVREGLYAGFRVLGAEDDAGRRLFAALDEKQRKRAIIAEAAPSDVIAGPGRADRLREITGLPAADMTPAQLRLLLQVINEYARNLDHQLAHQHLRRIREAGIEKVNFAWAGTVDGKPYYYRVHGPTILIEFDNSYPPGRRDGPVNHIHSVWRETGNDYGEDLLRKHYAESPHHRSGE